MGTLDQNHRAPLHGAAGAAPAPTTGQGLTASCLRFVLRRRQVYGGGVAREVLAQASPRGVFCQHQGGYPGSYSSGDHYRYKNVPSAFRVLPHKWLLWLTTLLLSPLGFFKMQPGFPLWVMAAGGEASWCFSEMVQFLFAVAS